MTDKGQPDNFLGRVIDRRFTVMSPLGRGGMGTVYRAKQSPLNRQVALKLLANLSDPDRVEEFHRRFFLEANTAAKLRHPNTITIFDYGSEVVDGDDVLYIAMELIEGQTLTRALKGGPFHPRRASHVMMQMAASLREAHEQGIVHRDLKPGNIMLIARSEGDEHERDFVKVLDFGLAKSFEGTDSAIRLTRAGTFLGSPRYVSPEQIEGRPVDPRADIYSFGCVAYRMLTGNVPFDGNTAVDIMMQHLKEEPPKLPPEVVEVAPPLLVDLVMECLEKDERQRPQDMAEVITRLKLCRAHWSGDGFFRFDDDITDQTPADRAPPAEPSDPPGDLIDDFDELEHSVTDPSGPPEFLRSAAPPADDTDPSGDPIRTTADRPSARLSPGDEQADAEDSDEDEPTRSDLPRSTRESVIESAVSDDTPKTESAIVPDFRDAPPMVANDLRRYREGKKRMRWVAVVVVGLLLVVLGALYALGAFVSLERTVRIKVAPQSVPREVIELAIESEPSGASVVDVGKKVRIGRTPMRQNWRPGDERKLLLELPGHQDREVTVPALSHADGKAFKQRVILTPKEE